MRSLGWSYSMVRRSMRELALKGYIVVTPAANQHEITTIKIPKFDTWEDDSAVPTCEHTKTSHDSALFSGVLCAVSTSEQSGEQSRPLISKKAQDLQAPKNAVEVKKGKKGEADSVRRPINAELRIATRKSFSPSERRKKLEKRLTEAVRKNRSAHDDELFDDEREAFAYLGYEPRDSSGLPCGFVFWVANLYGKHKTEALSPGNLCSKIIDRLMAEQGSCKALGSDPSEYYWPPDFQDHRDRLRAKERARQQTVHVGNGVRA